MKLWKISLLLAILTVGVIKVPAADLYVSPDGQDSGDRDAWASAYTNIQDALSNAGEGDTIYLAGQTFQLTTALSWTGVNNLTIRGGYEADPLGASPGNRDSDQWPTVIQQMTIGQRVMTIATVSGGLLEQLTITGGRNVSQGAGVHMTAASGMVMDQCRIIGNLALAQNTHGGGIWINNTSSLTMTNCVVRGNSAHATGGNHGSNGGGILNQGTLRMVDSILAENNNARNAAGWERGGAIYSSGTVVLDNCLIYGNTARWQGDGIYVHAGSLTMINCTMAHNGKQGVYRNSGTVSATNTIFWGHLADIIGDATLTHCNTESGVQAGSNNNISDDPLFKFGYYLGEGSPSRDTGTQGDRLLTAPYTTWIDGTADSGVVDMGYHYTAAANTSVSNLFVAADGDDLNNGVDPASPLRSLTAALAKAKDGTHIQVGPGIYTNGIESMPITVANINSLTIEGAGQGLTVFHGLNQQALIMQVDQVQNTVISGISLTGGFVSNTADTKGCGLYVTSSSVEFLRCAVTNNSMHARPAQGSGVFIDLGSVAKMTESLVADNKISTGGSGWGCYGAGIYNRGYLVLRDSMLTDNNNAVAGSVGMEYGGALYNTLGTAILRNCLLTGNTAMDRGDGIYSVSSGFSTSGNVILENCTVAYNGKEGLYQDGVAILSATNTIVWGHVSDIVGTVTLSHCNIGTGEQAGTDGNISADPLFEFGYYLGEGSPARDAGTNAVWLLDGNYTTRITGEPDTAPVDMGYHYFADEGPDLSYAVIYVASDGDDANAGTNSALPLRSLTAALSKAVAGSTVYIGPGQYTMAVETFPLSVSGLGGVTFEGDPDGLTVIDATGANTRVMTINNVNNGAFRNLTFTGGYLNLGAGGEERSGGVAVAASTVTFTDCVISNNYLRTLTALGGGLSIDAGSSVTMTRCQIVTNTVVSRGGNWPSQGAGVYNAGTLVMRECMLLDNNNNVPNTANRGGALYNVGSALLRNCLIARNQATTQGGGLHVAGGTLTLENCTVVDNLSQGLNRAGGTASATNTIFWGNTADIVGTVALGYCVVENGSGSPEVEVFDDNPLFVGPLEGDYRLTRGRSPCIDAGIQQPWMSGATDLLGAPRIMFGGNSINVDIGAYEAKPLQGSLFSVR